MATVDSTGKIPCLQAPTEVSPIIFMEFLQYAEFLAFVSMEPGSLHKDGG